METIFPQAEGFSGVFLVGYRKDPASPDHTQRIGTVVVKRTYTIVGGRLHADPDGETVRLADELNATTTIHESDIAPFKPHGDLFVKGFVVDPTDPAVLRVEGNVWLRRPAPAGCLDADDEEVERNLFGWEQRGSSGRLADAGRNPRDPAKKGFSAVPGDYPAQWPPPDETPPFKDPLHPIGFSNRYYNAYRRCFKVLAGTFPYFEPGWQIQIQRDPGGGHEAELTFSLPEDGLVARCFWYCGHGPDRASRWCDHQIPLVRDTLVVEPEHQRAYLLWRGVWDFDSQPQDRYRRLEVTVED